MHVLGQIAVYENRLDDAVGKFIEALELHQENHQTRLEVSAHGKLALVYIYKGNISLAESHARSAIRMAWKQSQIADAADGLRAMAYLYSKSDKHRSAAKLIMYAIQAHTSIHDRFGISEDILAAAKIMLAAGHKETAKKYAQKIEREANDSGHRYLLEQAKQVIQRIEA